MKDKNEKKKDLADLKKTLAENNNIFVTGYEKMTVSQDFQLAQDSSRRGRRLSGR